MMIDKGKITLSTGRKAKHETDQKLEPRDEMGEKKKKPRIAATVQLIGGGGGPGGFGASWRRCGRVVRERGGRRTRLDALEPALCVEVCEGQTVPSSGQQSGQEVLEVVRHEGHGGELDALQHQLQQTLVVRVVERESAEHLQAERKSVRVRVCV